MLLNREIGNIRAGYSNKRKALPDGTEAVLYLISDFSLSFLNLIFLTVQI